MAKYAVCYTATPGYLFQTVFSAIQARAWTSETVRIYVCFLGDERCEEQRQFQRICDRNGIDLLSAPVGVLDGIHPLYARLFLDRLLPTDVEEVLYLDGDTQVVGGLDALVHARPLKDGVLAVRDPMVFIRRVSTRFRQKIDSWWDDAGVPAELRDGYVNSGVLRLARETIGPLRAGVLALAGRLDTFRFPDQDAINLTLHRRAEPVSMSWNFPGFLLDTQLVELAPPRILHFMSDPRPWNAPLRPWGRTFYDPYRQFAQDNPEIAGFWNRIAGQRKCKYVLQQQYKNWTERRLWQSAEAARAVRDLERRTRH